jgi:hypothetical protein
MAAELNDDSNLRNITLTWEQIKGPPVTLASENTLGTSFPFADTDDKTFRFWVDKNTNRAQYKDVNIFYTPTSIMPNRAMGSALFEESMTIPNSAQTPGFVLPAATGIFDTNVDIQPAQIVSFDPVPDLVRFKSVKFEILTDAGFVVNPEDIYATYYYAASEYVYSIPLPNGVYRFRFYYDMGGLDYTVFTSPYIVSNSTSTAEDAWAIDDILPIANRHTYELTSLLRFTFIRQAVTTNHQQRFNAGIIGANGNIARPGDTPAPVLNLTPTFKELLDALSLYNIGMGSLLTLTRLDPSSIGS